MEKSDYYYRRRELMQNLDVPTMSEVRSELGEDLGSVFLEVCPDPLKPDMGLVPILSGAGDDLWISPSDILIGKVCLKPPFTDKHMKALTHQGILLIGSDIEKKFWNEAELVKAKALEEQEEMLRFMAEMEKRRAVNAAREEERAICREQKEQMALEFEERLKFELEELTKKLQKEYERLMKKQKRELDEEWEDKLEAAVAETTARLTAQFLEEMAKQEEILLRKFEIELKKENIKRRLQVKSIEECCQERFMELKHQMECKNIANIMYVICMERRKCQCERENFEKKYQTDMMMFQDAVTERDIEIAQLKKDLEKCQREVNLREECLLEILRQFQKFINFALRACPTQAEFLLSVEKMMVFELVDAVCKTDKLHGKRLANKLMRWRSDVELPSRASSSTKESLLAKDYHQCYNEVDTPVSEHSLTSADYLAAFHYDKHMYVREEFRNMMSQGIKVTPSNLVLWNKDVEHLQEVLLRSQTSLAEQKLEAEVEQEKLEADKEIQISLSEESDISYQLPKYSKSQHSRRSSVYFKGLRGDGGFLFPSFDSEMSEIIPSTSEIFEEIKPKSSDTSIIVEGICCKPCTIPKKKQQVVIENKPGIALIGVKNSLELHEDAAMRKRSDGSILGDKSGYSVKRNSIGILCAQDSLLKHRMSIKPTSKLFLHRESVVGKDIIALSKKSKSIDLGSDNGKSDIQLENVDLNMSRLSLSRNSFFVNKQSLIFKNSAKEIKSPVLSSQIKKSSKRTSLTESDNQKLQIVKSNQSLMKKIRNSSRLSLCRDSLQLMRSQSLMSKVSMGCSRKKFQSNESVEIKNGILAKSIVDETTSKGVKMSHIEIVPALLDVEEVEEIEKIVPSLCSDVDLSFNLTRDSPGIIYHKKKKPPLQKEIIEVKRDNFLTKPNVAHISGDEEAEEHVQEKEKFAVHRVNSLITIFKKHPSLIKTFTPCTK